MRFRAILSALLCCLATSAFAQSYPSPQLYQSYQNLTITASIATDELTVAIHDPNGNVPASSHPVLMSFRNSSVASGANDYIAVTGATAFTTAATSDSIGCITTALCRLWVWAINNGGTVDLCVYNAENGTNIADINEGTLQTSASGTGGGTSNQTLYCNASSVTTKAVRRLGYIDATWTSGTGWTGITVIQLFGPGIHKAGEIVQGPFYATSTSATTNSSPATPATTTPSISITPTSAVNLIYAQAQAIFVGSSSTVPGARLYRAAGGSAACTTAFGNIGSAAAATTLQSVSIWGIDAPATTSQQTYDACVYAPNGGAATINYCSQTFANPCTLEVYEIMAKREEELVNDYSVG